MTFGPMHNNTVLTQGRIIWYDHQRGYGFIRTRSEDVYVHASDITDLFFLNAGDYVEFELWDGPRGAYARSVRRAHIEW